MLNSFVVDFSLRQRVSANLTMFYIYQLPVPRLTEQETAFRMIVERAAKLICTTPEFQELWESAMSGSTWSLGVAAIDEAERATLRAELDGIIAHVYGLTEVEFRHILETFPLVEQPIKYAALAAYQEFALAPDDLALKELINNGETAEVEFKVAACWNARLGRSDPSMRDNIIQEVAAFLNSKEGGIVLIGVADDGTVVGLVDDYREANRSKSNRDGYQLFLLDVLRSNLVCSRALSYNISFGVLRGKDICRIDIEPAYDAVYLKNGEFYIREANRKLKLTTPEQIIKYSRARGRVGGNSHDAMNRIPIG
jgi:hypothetical protein